MNKLSAFAAAGIMAAWAGAAEARCVSVAQNDVTIDEVATLTEQAHQRRMQPGPWNRPDWTLFGGSGHIDRALVGRFEFSNAAEGCERQHVRQMQQNPGVVVTTGLTCGGQTFVIQNNQRGLVCVR